MLDLTQKNWSQQIKECNDADTLEDELISIIDIEKGINPGENVEVEFKFQSGDIKKIKMLSRIDTKNELEYYKNGGILQYVLSNMI